MQFGDINVTFVTFIAHEIYLCYGLIKLSDYILETSILLKMEFL